MPCWSPVRDAPAGKEEDVARERTKQVPGYRVQARLPMHIGWFGAVCEDADFTTFGGDREPYVEVLVRLGMIPKPYTLVLTYEQALEADIIEKV